VALASGAAVMLTGCQADSWFDPSVVGYWENTPTTMPILDRIAAIEEKTPEIVEPASPVREDLIAEAQPYRLGPSDEVEIRIPNYEQVGFMSTYPRQVDQRGYVNLPRLGPVYVLGRTDIEAQDAIAQAIQDAQILAEPSVTLVVTAPRQLTFSILGGVRSPGTFLVTKPDYRLLDAMAAAGGLDENIEKLYIVRQIPLSEQATGRTTAPTPTNTDRPTSAPPPDPDQLLKAIEDLTQPPPENKNGGGGLGVRGAGRTSGERRAAPGSYTGLQPEKTPAPSDPKVTQPIDLIDSNDVGRSAQPAPQPVQPPTADGAAPAPATPGVRARTRWVFINGQWTREGTTTQTGTVAPSNPAADPLAGTAPNQDLMTQRVIEVPVKPLLAGQSDVNVVIRPGDVIRVPVNSTGVVYVGGQVARPGTFNLPPTGKLTLIRVIDAAGGLSQLGIPERVDLTRMIGSNREATIRLNMRAIAERTQPDVILKADDRINVGTNFWAFPLAIIRNGFRMSYGFGFLIDRNFGNDVFGPPPENNRFN
jgi:polysaccharide export outer membrane protein